MFILYRNWVKSELKQKGSNLDYSLLLCNSSNILSCHNYLSDEFVAFSNNFHKIDTRVYIH